MKNKQLYGLFMCVMSLFSLMSADDDCRNCESHQYVPRGASTDLVWIDAMSFYNRTRQYPNQKYFYSGMTIYQQGRPSRELGAAFLLGNSNEIAVDQTPTPGAVNSIELGLGNVPPAAPFSSVFSIKPSSRQFTYVGNLFVDLEAIWCGLWGDFTYGITNQHHRLNCCETGNTSTMIPGIQTVADSLNRTAIDSTRFYCGLCPDGKRRTGFEDIFLRLGYDYFWCGDNRVGFYLAGTVPAGRSPTNEYIFEPLVGTKHGSLGFGILGDFEWDICDSQLTFMTDAYYRYVFNHQECRTFDLCPNGPFSRYILAVDSSALGFPFPAANVTTAKVGIVPRSTIQWWLAANYEVCRVNVEAGYNLFWRQKERLKDCCIPLSTTVGIYNVTGIGVGQVTDSTATMTSVGKPDIAFIPIEPSDLNINSGLAGALLTNKFYGAVSWTGLACGCFEYMGGLGGSYEFVTERYRCNALQNWAVFGKLAIGF